MRRVGHRSLPRLPWRGPPVWSACGSRMKAAIPPRPSRTAPARWWLRARCEIGAGTVVTASTGNAGAALAGMAAAAGQPAVILAPRTAPPAKVAQLQVFGAQVVLIDGNYDELST